MKVLSVGLVAIFTLSAFFPTHAAVSSKYASQIQKCLDARSPEGNGNVKAISEFVCPGGRLSDQEAAYQVVVDLEFKKIDSEIEAELRILYDMKGKNIADFEKIITSRFDEDQDEKHYISRYRSICDASNPSGAVGETIQFFNGKISTDFGTKDYFADGVRCNALVDAKIKAYKDVAWLFAERSIERSFEDDKKEYMKKIRGKYENFLFKWSTYVAELARIKNKWNLKTKNRNGL